ncbi:hypothetical protein P4603_26220 [Priestia aryabhattai]|uniref:hypothetical protein n=1 Tax=Priestia aryabhattai TaxID=412384 RepID=UPI002E1FC4DE|nr:hypothetical protein [Priestia aryabhattai]
MSKKNTYETCLPEKYYTCDFHSETLYKWVIKNTPGWFLSTQLGRLKGQGFGVCGCEDKYEDDRYYYYENVYECDDVFEMVPGLTEEEKENIENIGNLRIFLCPECGTWEFHGDCI